jgi:hypothetical protein
MAAAMAIVTAAVMAAVTGVAMAVVTAAAIITITTATDAAGQAAFITVNVGLLEKPA